MNTEPLIDFVMFFARCPCCEQTVECLKGCTFHTDCPTDAELMDEAREAITKAEG